MSRRGRRRWLAPQVLQTSSMDCGPASLACILEGFGIQAAYARLREACQTSVDGTSIDRLEEIAEDLGLEVEQRILPPDVLLSAKSGSFPAMAAVQLPSGAVHFVVLWSVHGDYVQVMDPATGRRFVRKARLTEDLLRHAQTLEQDQWEAILHGPSFIEPLVARLRDLGVEPEAFVVDAMGHESDWVPLARLDAAARMVASIVAAGALRRGREAAAALASFIEEDRDSGLSPGADEGVVPGVFWAVEAGDWPAEAVKVTGAVVLTVNRVKSVEESVPLDALAPELVAALSEDPATPGRDMFRLLVEDGPAPLAAVAGGFALTAAGVVVAIVLFRTLVDLGEVLGPPEQRVGAAVALTFFISLLLLLELPIGLAVQWLARRFETRVRLAFLRKLPRISDRYLQSRPTSDTSERVHSLYRLRNLPFALGQAFRFGAEIVLTVVGIAWLDPDSLVIAGLVAALSFGLPVVFQPVLVERDLRVRTLAGSLSRFYLDTLLGLSAIRAHGAEPAVRNEHEAMLVAWARASRSMLRATVVVDVVNMLATFGLAAWLFSDYLARHADTPGALLLLFWALNLPALGQELGALVRQYPMLRNTLLRLVEPLGASEEPAGASSEPMAGEGPVSLQFEHVELLAGGHTVLEAIDVAIAPGEHVAIVGPSGAGKSSLVGLLLGWHRPTGGEILADGRKLEGATQDALRQQTAWVDPAVQLWNRSLLDNLTYGGASAREAGAVLEVADLEAVLRDLPDGLQTGLGEGGGRLSGGEGQRVRFGRALLRAQPRLVVLDEAFRGLERPRRARLLAAARARWRAATLLCVTHDLEASVDFGRVLVVADGRIVEDGDPRQLLEEAHSRYRALWLAEQRAREEIWDSADWRRLRLEGGRLREETGR